MNPKKFKIILYLPLILFFIANFFYFSPSAKAEVNASMPQWSNPLENLQVKIPNLIFTKSEAIKCAEINGKKICNFPWIGEYIAGIYKYAIGIVGILAAVVLMVGGVMWIIAGGSATMIGEAKAWIGASLTGLVIALTSYVILYQVNPALVEFKGLGIQMVKKLDELSDEFSRLGCPNEEEKKQGFEALITGYCQPDIANFNDKNDFLCAVGLNCSCPAGRESTRSCYNSKNYYWSACKNFDPATTSYCTATYSEVAPGRGQVAADLNCFKLGTLITIGDLSPVPFLVTDKGAKITGRKFDVWVDNCAEAKSITGKYTVTSE